MLLMDIAESALTRYRGVVVVVFCLFLFDCPFSPDGHGFGGNTVKLPLRCRNSFADTGTCTCTK